MIKKGVYAASLSVLDENGSLNIDETISHAENINKRRSTWSFLLWKYWTKSINIIEEKKELVSKLSLSKFKKNFFWVQV